MGPTFKREYRSGDRPCKWMPDGRGQRERGHPVALAVLPPPGLGVLVKTALAYNS